MYLKNLARSARLSSQPEFFALRESSYALSQINSYSVILQNAIKNYHPIVYTSAFKSRKVRLIFDVTRLLTNPGHSGINNTLNLCIDALSASEQFIVNYFIQKDYLKSIDISCLSPAIVDSLVDISDNHADFDIYLSIYHPIPQEFLRSAHVKTCLCVHDIFHLTRSDLYPDPSKFITKDIAKNAYEVDCVFTPSQFSLNQLIEYDKSNKLKCSHVINWPVTIPHVKSYVIGDSTVKELNVLFAYQNNDPRKNIRLTIDVVNNILLERPELKVGIFGKINDFDLSVFPDNAMVSLYDSPSNDELFQVYNKSILLLYLSTSEGFGLPPLEAICLGSTPIMFRNSSLSEIFPNLPLIENSKLCPKSIAKKAIETIDHGRITATLSHQYRSAYSFDGFKARLCLMLKSLIID